jgi:hypothetical protein
MGSDVPAHRTISDPNARTRELLGADAHGLSDQQVESIRVHADAMARLIVEMFLQRAA